MAGLQLHNTVKYKYRGKYPGDGRGEEENEKSCNDWNCAEKNSDTSRISTGGSGDRGKLFDTTMVVAGIRFPYFDDPTYDATNPNPPPTLKSARASPEDLTKANNSNYISTATGLIQPYPNWSLGDLLECIMCRDTLIQATIIDCGHTFCCTCLQEWLRRKSWCPICQQPVTSQRKNLIVDRIVEYELPKLSVHTQIRFKLMRDSRLRAMRCKLSKPQVFRRLWWGGIIIMFYSLRATIREQCRYARNKGILRAVQNRWHKIWFCFIEDQKECTEVKLGSVHFISPVGLVLIGIFMGWLFTAAHLWSLLVQSVQFALSSFPVVPTQAGVGCSVQCKGSRSY